MLRECCINIIYVHMANWHKYISLYMHACMYVIVLILTAIMIDYNNI